MMKKTFFAVALFSMALMLTDCGHNVAQLSAGSALRLGSGEFSLSYTDGLFLNSVNRENTIITAEIDSTVGASYDPVTGTFKGIKGITIETGPQLTGYTVDAAKQSPEAVAAYYDALKAYYESKAGKPAQPLISDEKSKAATKSVTDVIKAAIEKAKAIIDEDGESADQGGEGGEEDSDFRCDGNCNYDDLTGNASISWQLSVALKLLSFDGYQRKFPSSDEYYQVAMEHFVSQLVSLRSLGKKTTPLRIKYVTVENKVVTRLMFAYIPKQGTPSDVECPNCWFVNPDDAD